MNSSFQYPVINARTVTDTKGIWCLSLPCNWLKINRSFNSTSALSWPAHCVLSRYTTMPELRWYYPHQIAQWHCPHQITWCTIYVHTCAGLITWACKWFTVVCVTNITRQHKHAARVPRLAVIVATWGCTDFFFFADQWGVNSSLNALHHLNLMRTDWASKSLTRTVS